MGSEWNQFRLGDITEWSSGGTPSKSKDKYWNGEIPWISASSMDGNRYNDSKLKITPLGLKNGSRLASKDNILLLVRGSILHQKIQVGIAEREVAFNQDVKALKVKLDIVEPWYLLFWFMANKSKLLGLVENTGIGAGKLDTTILKNILVDVPPKHERKRILNFLKGIDNKIELNRQINTTLESMAQALFKSWFVDFDPVIDNALAAGHPIPEELQAKAQRRAALGDQRQPLPAEIQKLFPSSFVFNEELGWVPEGWRIGTLLDQANLLSGGTPKTNTQEYWNGDIPWASAKDVSQCGNAFLIDTEKKITTLGLEKSSTKLIEKFSTVIVSRGATTGRLTIFSDTFAMNQTCYALRSKNLKHFYQYCKVLDVVSKLVYSAHGSIFDTITTSTFQATRILLDNPEITADFERRVSPLFLRIRENLNESATLSRIRGLLLPKLLSGQLQIPYAEAAAENTLETL